VAERTFRWLRGDDAGTTVTLTTEGSDRGEYRVVGCPGSWAEPSDVVTWLKYGVAEEVAGG